jgi:RHH-type proline utilization regulon transcriptional repressor/proline dehydrogenase/delta 1-pyrroline-5-carboxylate dehydrogenase
VRAGQSAFAEWSQAGAGDRAAVLFGAAADLRKRRHELAALEVFEAGKPWAEADADVCEAIDFCEYYGREALRLAAGGLVQSPPGERNRLTYQARGVVAVISPWNFPLAIPAGMVTAALVAGNAVCFKPAEQAPAIAYGLVLALERGGLPQGVLSFLPGRGEEVGAALVEHPGVAAIAFTGSREVGLGIVAAAAVHRPGQRQVKRVIAEMGGKNPAYVDADADLDGAVPAIVASAFGFAGQKCSALSRLIVHRAVRGELLDRLVGAAGELRVDHPRGMGTQMGPLIDADAQAKVRSYVDIGRTDGRVVLARDHLPREGFFAGPTVVVDLPTTSRLATEEVFGPVLAVFEANDVDHALALANDTPYALTAGVFSRSPSTIERLGRALRAGNIYVNRGITGAVVGRQPFGGYGLSGVGSKAGGPDYLSQFLEPRVVTENTVRQGFSPDLA